MNSEEDTKWPPLVVALLAARRELRELAYGYEDLTEPQAISFDELLGMGEAKLRHRQQVNAELRAMADGMEIEAVALALKEKQRGGKKRGAR